MLAVKLLLQYDNSCADCQDHHGNTPLHLACSQQASQKLVQELMVGVSSNDDVIMNHTPMQVHTDLMIRNDDQKLAEELCLSDKTKRQVGYISSYPFMSSIFAVHTRLAVGCVTVT